MQLIELKKLLQYSFLDKLNTITIANLLSLYPEYCQKLAECFYGCKPTQMTQIDSMIDDS